MKLAFEARKLADYITNLESFETHYVYDGFCYEHIGALLTDIVLQSGLNYTTVVKPRVQRVLLTYADADTTTKFVELATKIGLPEIIKWTHSTKLSRLERLLEFVSLNNIDTCSDLKLFLVSPNNRKKLIELNGIGPKTIDYTLKLLNFDTVAVDRHIYSFVEMADIKITGYQLTKQVVEYAADFLQISRSAMDYSIWKYMSSDIKYFERQAQTELCF